MTRHLLIFAVLSSSAGAAEPRVCETSLVCEQPDEVVDKTCSSTDVERCLIVERKNCNYFVRLHGKVVAGDEWGFIGKPEIHTDKQVEHYAVIGAVGGAIQVVIDAVASEVLPLPGSRAVGGRRIHLSSDYRHYTYVRNDGNVWKVNVDGTWHQLPSWTREVTYIQYGPHAAQVLVQIETAGGNIQQRTFDTHLVSTVEYDR